MPDLKLNIVDGMQVGYRGTIEKIKDFRPDVLGISFYTPVALSAYKLANDIKEQFPQTLVIMGGPHATALPEEVIEKSLADAVAIGEGEQTMLELVYMYENNGKITNAMDYYNISGLAFRNDGQIKRSPPRTFIGNIDSIPFPARDLIDMKKYSGWYVHKRLPETKMLMSRGCPYHCTFCDEVVWKSSKPWVRLRTPKNIVDEIELLTKEFGIKEVMDDSDEFNNNVLHALAICEEMKQRGLDVPWKTQLRAWPLPENLVKAMAEAGCWYVHLGIESGNPETLRGIQKQITVEQIIETCTLLKKYNIQVLGLFMLFNVWEEEKLCFEDVMMTRNTLRFAQRMIDKGLLDYIGWSVTTPYPGSQLYNVALKYNLIKPELVGHWDAWLNEDTFVMRLPGVDEREMARMKTIGQILRGRLTLRSRRFGLKDVPFFAKKGMKLAYNEIRSWSHTKK
jgi:magnesium-protoporphyrin IX monomethyl ester (oxidative) cyclase